jgi:hypothetical protein
MEDLVSRTSNQLNILRSKRFSCFHTYKLYEMYRVLCIKIETRTMCAMVKLLVSTSQWWWSI